MEAHATTAFVAPGSWPPPGRSRREPLRRAVSTGRPRWAAGGPPLALGRPTGRRWMPVVPTASMPSPPPSPSSEVVAEADGVAAAPSVAGTVAAAAAAARSPLPDWLPPDAADITDPYAVTLLRSQLTRVPVTVPDQAAPVATAHVLMDGPATADPTAPVVLLLHGFDSSCLEFRRLLPALTATPGVGCVAAVCIYGWGFTAKPAGGDFSPKGKATHVAAYVDQVLPPGRPVVLLGASIGGALAVEVALGSAAAVPPRLAGLVLLDAQIFVEKAASPAVVRAVPALAAAGAEVLRARWLRRTAGRLSYADAPTWATEEAMRIGRLHTLTPGWRAAAVAFIVGAGFAVRDRLPDVPVPALVVWGADDRIVEVAAAGRLRDELPQCAGVVIVPDAGHCPHIEKAAAVAAAVGEFVRGLG
ncbi:hypothetical protein MMPV_007088 [Pyropia vietnamensis]